MLFKLPPGWIIFFLNEGWIMTQRKCICFSATITRTVLPSHYIPNSGMSGISVETVHSKKKEKKKKTADGGGQGEEGGQ